MYLYVIGIDMHNRQCTGISHTAGHTPYTVHHNYHIMLPPKGNQKAKEARFRCLHKSEVYSIIHDIPLIACHTNANIMMP